MIRHVAGLADIVEDVNEALKFYRDTLGLEVKEQDGNDYAVIIVPGVLHFGVWNRAHAAQSMFGDREAIDRVPLRFTLEFEVDRVEEMAVHLENSDWPVPKAHKPNPGIKRPAASSPPAAACSVLPKRRGGGSW